MFKALALILLIIGPSIQKTKDEWTNRRIYQLLTDRFASSNGASANCNLSNYCGGDFQGIINHLDYIQGMGFDAIWISPIVDNYDQGYHGYWARDMYGINSHYGGADALKKLVTECHKRDIWVMVDIVANHMGNTDQNYSQNKPFNDGAHYHDYCTISQSDFDTHNLHNIEHCRLAGLADLNHQNPWVSDQLLQWGKWLVSEFGFDAIRADTVMMVPADFWKKFSDAVGVYTIGEVFDGDFGFLKQFVGPLDSLLNYPNFYWLKSIFNNWEDMSKIETYYGQWKNAIGWQSMKYLGNFNDNHDNSRFLYNNNNDSGKKKFKAYTAFCLTSYGIPIVYYGSEQFYDGGNDPQNREILWNNLNPNHEMYVYIATINHATKATGALAQDQIQRWSSAELYAFSRGKLFAAFSSKQDKQIHQTITYHPYSEGNISLNKTNIIGQKICNIFYPKEDCQTITGGKFELYLNNGEVKIFIPA